jgi:hypothetical protein
MAGFLTLLIAVALIVVLLRTGGAWPRGRGPTVERGQGDEARLDRMETALTMLESRLDDLQDQQRFLERLLANRTDPTALPGRTEPDQDTDRSILFDIQPSDEDEAEEGEDR